MRKLLPARAFGPSIAPSAVSREMPGTSDVDELDNPVRVNRATTRDRRLSFWFVGALVLALLAGPRCALGGPVTLASYNLYLGADLGPIISAPTPPEFLAAVGATFGNVVATDFNARANAIADQIAATKPHFIGLQEVVTWQTGPPVDFGQSPPPATNVAFDYLQILSNALSARGLSYAPIAQVQNLDIQVPGAVSSSQLANFRLTDSDVLLAMTSLPGGMTYANTQGQNFVTALPVPLPDGTTLLVPRGWTAADVTVDGKTFRLVNTHLEAFFELVQLGQALELLGGPGNTALPQVFIGDFNSDAAPPADPPGATYAALLGAGFADAGLLGGIGGVPTCCQDADLMNEFSELLTRIDLALFRGEFQVLFADVIGEAQEDRIASDGLWPSDHAGIVVTLSVVAEPSIVVLLVSGLGLLVLIGARGRRRAAA